MTLTTWLEDVAALRAAHPSLRYGQAVMLVLYRERPDLYDRAIAAGHDATYTTETDAVKATLAFVMTQLDGCGEDV